MPDMYFVMLFLIVIVFVLGCAVVVSAIYVFLSGSVRRYREQRQVHQEHFNRVQSELRRLDMSGVRIDIRVAENKSAVINIPDEATAREILEALLNTTSSSVEVSSLSGRGTQTGGTND